MDERQYVDELRAAHRGEVFGEAFYATAARLCADPDGRRKWTALTALERQTKARIAGALSARGESVREGIAVRSLGHALGVAAAVLPQRVVVRAIGAVVRGALSGFERLEREGARWDGGELLADLVAHEVAQVDFFAREARGEGASSLERVEALLA